MQLKYIDLSYNDIEVLPDSITRLVNLHTLKLISCEKLRELPIDIQKLVNLKHLEITECYSLTHMPYGLGRLTPLQTLTLFIVSEDPVGSSKHCGGLAELNKLNDLRGEIVIKILKWVKDASSDTKAANLKGKQHLNTLSLGWGRGNVADAGDDENLLDGLQPHRNLKSLTVHGYGGARFSIWLSSLTNLSELYIYNCKKCQQLPPLYQLPSLQTLSLSDMDSLEYISNSDINDEVSASLLTVFFPSLESLVLSSCCNLKGWWKGDIVDNSDQTTMTSTSWSHQYQQHISVPSFPRLCYLEICHCSLLTSMPLFPYLDNTLYLKSASWKALQQTMALKMNTAGASSLPSSFPPLSKLKYLHLEDMRDTEYLPEEWLQNLTSLKKLKIWECPRLTSLSQYLRHNNSLTMLDIRCCEEVDLFSDVDDDGAGRPKRLQCLILKQVTKMKCLPTYLQHVTTLQYLMISRCPSLMTLPEWIGSLASLQNLVIDDCPNLTSLPEEISCLTSLQILSILRCPHLEQRCQKEIGEEWNKIARVPEYSNTYYVPYDLTILSSRYIEQVRRKKKILKGMK
ncbi:disease resistance protein RGA2-like [Quercus robur]|uniref:disease resistance protein RGA2-like n=1 Tax=Quercus robur TaxID=38942 RepID=UPI0021612D54|nr:disease resistance protein RGA2-like [Quercus robur]